MWTIKIQILGKELKMQKIPSIFVCSTLEFSGKSAICIGLALKYKAEGYKVGYFKPLGWETTRGPNGEKVDEDALLMSNILNLKQPLEMLCPIVLEQRYFEDVGKRKILIFQKKILEAYDEVSEDMDLMILEGAYTLHFGATLGLDSGTISKQLDSNMLMVAKADSDLSVDNVVATIRCLDLSSSKVIGIILNRLSPGAIGRIKSNVVSIFERNNIPVLGIIPDNKTLRSPTVDELVKKIDCKVLTKTDKMDNVIEEFMIGAMTPQSALSYFRKSQKKAVITGGDRPDIQLAALNTDLSALILTGNYYPDVRILTRAEEIGVPVILVPTDTYTTIKQISNLTGRIRPNDTQKIELARKMVLKHVSHEVLLEKIF
jgi:BioD-like phosphotransacetylase family protein